MPARDQDHRHNRRFLSRGRNHRTDLEESGFEFKFVGPQSEVHVKAVLIKRSTSTTEANPNEHPQTKNPVARQPKRWPHKILEVFVAAVKVAVKLFIEHRFGSKDQQ